MIITLFRSEWEAYTTEDQIIDAEWDDVAEALMIFHRRNTKEEAPMFNLWQFDPNGGPGRKYHDKSRETWDDVPGTIRRCTENAQGLWGLVLDYDKIMTMEQAIDEVDGFDFVLYSSFSHSDEKDKFRVIIPFTRMMTKEEFGLKKDDMKTCFPQVDTASFSMSQAMFLHSGTDKNKAIALRGHGAQIDPDFFLNKEIPIVVPVESRYVYEPPTDEQKRMYADKIRESLLTCSNVNRSGGNEGITLASICRSAGLSFEDFGQICQMIARDGSSLKTLDVQGQFWGVVGADCKIKGETRDKFILAHGGRVPSFSKQTSEQQLEYIRQRWKTK